MIIVVDDHDSLDLDNFIFMETEETGKDSTLNDIIQIYAYYMYESLFYFFNSCSWIMKKMSFWCFHLFYVSIEFKNLKNKMKITKELKKKWNSKGICILIVKIWIIQYFLNGSKVCVHCNKE